MWFSWVKNKQVKRGVSLSGRVLGLQAYKALDSNSSPERERKEVEMQLAAGLYSFGCSEKAISLPFAASKGHPPACLGLWTSARWVSLSDSSTFLFHFLLRTPAIALDSAKWSCYAPLTPIRISRFAAVNSTCKQNCFHPTQCTRTKNLRLGQTGWDAILLSTPSFFS